jgi:ribosomal protein S6--L-glutamate ligase
MWIAILSRNRWIHSTKRLVQAGEQLGHRVRVIDPLQCTMLLDSRRSMLFHKGKRVLRVDVAVPRIGASATQFGLAVITTLEHMRVPVVNPAVAIAAARDKFLALQVLSSHKVGIPRTLLARDPRDLEGKLDLLGKMPVVLKLAEGTHGVGVMLAESRETVQSIVLSFWDFGKSIFAQKFVEESKGRDIRAFVVGNEVVAAMRRTARMDEFRSNIHRGGVGEPIELEEPYVRAALRATRLLGLRVAGVDLLESDAGPLVMEVNASPGLRGIEQATGRDVAGAIIRHAVNFAMQATDGTA